MGNYPWLADSWPAPNLQTSKESINCCPSKLDSDRYYNGESVRTLTFLPPPVTSCLKGRFEPRPQPMA